MGKAFRGIGLLALLAFALAPVIWMGVVAFTYADPLDDDADKFSFWSNFAAGWTEFDFPRYAGHSLILSGGTVIVGLIVAIWGALSLTYRTGRSRANWDGALAMTQMLPLFLVLLPLFMLYVFVGQAFDVAVRGTYPGLILAHVVYTVPVAAWMLRGYFETIPRSLYEAALLDGCSVPQMLRFVLLPLIRPGIAATAVFIFVLSWNELLVVSVLSNADTEPFSLHLLTFLGQQSADWGQLMAVGLMVSVPLAVIFWSVHRWLLRGARDALAEFSH